MTTRPRSSSWQVEEGHVVGSSQAGQYPFRRDDGLLLGSLIEAGLTSIIN